MRDNDAAGEIHHRPLYSNPITQRILDCERQTTPTVTWLPAQQLNRESLNTIKLITNECTQGADASVD